MPALSVVLPLIHDLGMAEACLESWNRQSVARDRLQLVIVDHGLEGVRASRLRQSLRAGDRWIEVRDAAESVLYDHGARAAAAPLLLFTESHCIARPDAVSTVLQAFHAPDLAAAVLSSGHVHSRDPLARLQAELERDWVEQWPAGHWRTLSLRGFAIRRATFFALGGFQKAHGRFCETAMGIELARNGLRIGSTAEAIDHLNCTRVSDLIESLSDCARGQAAWREEMEARVPGVAREWLGEDPTLARRAAFAPATSRSLLRAIFGSLLSDLGRPGYLGKAPAMSRKLPWLLAGCAQDGVVLRGIASAVTARALFGWWVARARGAPLLPHYRRLWFSAFQRGFLQHLSHNPLRPVWPAIPAGGLAIAEFPDGAIAGFHAPELEEAFRWSGAAALMRLRFAPGDHTVKLSWLPPASVGDAMLTVYFNGRRISARRLSAGLDSLDLRVSRAECDPSGRQELTFTCRASRSPDGERLLGLAIVAVEVRTLECGGGEPPLSYPAFKRLPRKSA